MQIVLVNLVDEYSLGVITQQEQGYGTEPYLLVEVSRGVLVESAACQCRIYFVQPRSTKETFGRHVAGSDGCNNLALATGIIVEKLGSTTDHQRMFEQLSRKTPLSKSPVFQPPASICIFQK